MVVVKPTNVRRSSSVAGKDIGFHWAVAKSQEDIEYHYFSSSY